jgi:RNA polymerase sigma-70 factor (ECF subfamily)
VLQALASKRPLSVVADGEPLDFAEVYQRYVQVVARWAARLGGPDIDVEDVVQDVFLSVQGGLSRFRGESRFATWLYRITENAIRRRRRKLRWRRWLGGSGEDVAGELPSTDASPEELVESRQAQARVYKALDGMREKYRNLLILFELEELSGEEIAGLTGTKTATVWVQLHRARAELLQRLEALEKGA